MAEEDALQRIEAILKAGGYPRDLESVSPFDTITRGLAWCIENSNRNVKYQNLDYSDDFTLGEKIQFAESLEFALRQMRCPHPLQAHQIRGIDYPAIFPVVQWLVKRVLDQQPLAEDRESLANVANAGQLKQSQEFSQKLKSSSDSSHDILIPEDSLDKSSYDEEQVIDLQNQIKWHKEKLSSLKKERSESFVVDTRAAIDKKVKRREYLDSEIAKLRLSFGDSERQIVLDQLLTTLRSLKVLNKQNPEPFTNSQQEELSTTSTVERKNSLRKELASINRAVILHQRRIDDYPVQSELIQYERYFMELYVNIQTKLRETRKYYASYNALAEVNDLSMKEISLLNSINSQYEMAMSTPQGRAKFAESMQGISAGVQQKLEKMKTRSHEKTSALDLLKQEHGAALANRRQYFALLKQLQEEFARIDIKH